MTISQQLIALLKKHHATISTAESCTGGMLSASLVDISGASEVFEEGYITYSDRVKAKVLGVSTRDLNRYSAVSAQVVTEMALGCIKRAGTQMAIAVSGYADGAMGGCVYIGISLRLMNMDEPEVLWRQFQFSGNRQEVRVQTVSQAIFWAVSLIKERW